MIDWLTIETAPTTRPRSDEDRYLIGSFPKGLVSRGHMHSLNESDFTTTDGVFHAPTHWAELNTPEEALLATNWHQEAKEHELAFMSAKDDYADVARALGFTETTFFGDPMANHAEIVERARAAFDALSKSIGDTRPG